MLIPNLADAEDATQAQVDSRDFSDILAPAFSYTGVLSGCAVAAQGTPNMTVAISAGVVVVNGVVVTVAAGNVTISANASGNARFDLICVDAAGVKSAVAGIPSTSPVFPNPAGKVVLAAVRVPAGAASISNAKLVDKRVFNTLSSLAFGAAGDTNLYRNGANSLQTDGSLYVKGNAAGIGYVFNPLSAAGNALATIAPGDTNYRHAIDVNGGMGWGPGNSAGDTNLYRLQSGHLKTDGFFQAGQGAILRYGDAAQVTLGSLNQFFGGAPAAAGIAFGSAGDTNLYRGQANTLQTTGSLFFKGGAGTYPIAVYANLTDGNSQFYIDGGTGRLNWGPGNSGADTWIYRGSNPGLLGVHTDLWVEGSVLPQGNMQAVSSVSAYQGNAFWQTQIGWDGTMPGPGISFSSAKDTNLYRLSAGALQTDGSFYAKGQVYSQPAGGGVGFVYFPQSAGGAAFYSAIAGESNARFRFSSDGFMAWGPGGSVGTDTTLYRVQPGILGTDGQIYLRSASSYLAFYQTAEAAARFYIGPGGNLNWGPGTATQDTNLYRAAAGLLLSDSIIASTGAIIANRLAPNQIWLNADGAIYFGSASDTRIYRNGASSLQTDGSLYVAGSFEAVGGRIGVIGKAVTDWNNALDNGWYMAAGALNPPGGLATWFIGEVQAHGATGWRIQRVTDFTLAADSQVWERRQLNGTWGAWVKSGVYTVGVDVLRTDGALQVGGQLFVNQGLANQIYLASDGRMYFGSASDTNLYRAGADQLKTDDQFTALGFQTAQPASGVAYIYAPASAAGYILGSLVSGEANFRWLVDINGRMNWGPGGAVATDTTLYRYDPSYLKTDKGFWAAGNILVGANLYVDWANGGSKLFFGSASDTNLYRAAADSLKTDDSLTVAASLVVNSNDLTGSKIYFGSALDTILYRSAADNLKTDSNLRVGKAFVIDVANGNYRMYFGSALDTNLYRYAVNALKTDGYMLAGAIGTGGTQPFAVSGSNIGKFPIYDTNANLLGYVPIYQA